MKLVLVLVCLLGVGLGASLERKPHRCESPPLLTGKFIFSSQTEDTWLIGRYEYDALQQRIRLFEAGQSKNQTFTVDILMLFREGVAYQIDHKSRTCRKSIFQSDFQPMGVPPNASLLGSAVIGSSSRPGEGLLVNTWTAPIPNGGNYMVTVTEFGCIPVSTAIPTKELGWAIVTYMDAVRGIVNPNALNPPPFCSDQELQAEEKPVDFFTVLKNTWKKPNAN